MNTGLHPAKMLFLYTSGGAEQVLIEDTQFSADLLTKDSRLMFHSSD